MYWLLCLLPLVEAPIEAWFEKVKKISVGHAWTMIVRMVLMVAIGFVLVWAEDTIYWWQGTALSAGIFILMFNYMYNALTKRKLTYLRAKGIDKIYSLAPWWGRLIWELCFFGSGVLIYLNPNIFK